MTSGDRPSIASADSAGGHAQGEAAVDAAELDDLQEHADHGEPAERRAAPAPGAQRERHGHERGQGEARASSGSGSATPMASAPTT